MTNKDLNLEDLTKRLDLIIYLLIKQSQEKDKATNRETIGELFEWGLKDLDIANIFGKSRGYISSEITQLKKSKKKQEVSK